MIAGPILESQMAFELVRLRPGQWLRPSFRRASAHVLLEVGFVVLGPLFFFLASTQTAVDFCNVFFVENFGAFLSLPVHCHDTRSQTFERPRVY